MKRTAALLVVVGVLMIALMALAGCGKGEAKFPTKSISLICPPKPGGISDTLCRALGQATEKPLGATINVINKAGAAGAVGLRYGADASGDGYTVTYVVCEIAILPHLGHQDLTYNSFDLLARTNLNPAALTVHTKDKHFTDLASFIDYAKDHPKELRVGNSGPGSIWNLAALGVEDKCDIELTHVPFKGSGPAVQNLMGRHLDAVLSGASEVQIGLDTGDLKILAVFADERSEYFPDVPTAAEQGVNLSIAAWGGLGVPTGTPNEVKQTLLDGFKQGFDNADFHRVMKDRNVALSWLEGEDFVKFAADQTEFFGDVIEKYDIKFE